MKAFLRNLLENMTVERYHAWQIALVALGSFMIVSWGLSEFFDFSGLWYLVSLFFGTPTLVLFFVMVDTVVITFRGQKK